MTGERLVASRGSNPDTLLLVTKQDTLDDIGRIVYSEAQYPDATVTTTLSHSSVGYLLASEREVTHHESNITETVSDEFVHDNVLRPHTHKVRYGNGWWVFANRMEYDGEDRLITKWVGGMPMEEDRFLQEVNYACGLKPCCRN